MATKASSTEAIAKAILGGDVVGVQDLLAKGADPNGLYLADTGSWDTETYPLIVFAAGHGDDNIVRVLLNAGANIDALWLYNAYKWPDGYEGERVVGNALYAAAMRNHADVVELLLQRGAQQRSEALLVAARG